VESGPAAGVIAAAYLGEALGHRNLISFDMGGTTAKAGLVKEGAPGVTKDYEVGATAKAGVGSGRGSGYPIRTPVLDLVEIGASTTWSRSAGPARPTPAGWRPRSACRARSCR